jgi:uncharacterized protein YggT (Ycf19 family)
MGDTEILNAFTIIVFWLVCSICVGIFAGRRGRSSFGYFLGAIIFSPLLAWLILLAKGPYEDYDDRALRKLVKQNRQWQ